MKPYKFEKLKNKLRSFIYTSRVARASSRFETDDVIQNVFLQWVNQRNENDFHSSKFNTAWLRKAANGALCNLMRFNLAAKRSMRNEQHHGDSTFEVQNQRTPDDQVELRELGLFLLSCIDQLSGFEQELVKKRLFHRETFANIANRTESTVHRVRTDFHLALKKLHYLMTESNFEK